MQPPPPILVVEDDPAISRALRRELVRRGVPCVMAHTATEAAIGRSFHIAIVDINLPDGNGLDLFETLKARGLVTHGIFFSATDNEEERLRAKSLGLFIPKTEGVVAAVDAALRHSRTSAIPRSTTRPASSASAEDEAPPPRARLASSSD